MRFALRKQDKIKAYFEPHGDEMLNRIKESLTQYFSADRSDFPEGLGDIESDYNQLPGEPYPTIAINDAGNPERMIEFYVTGKQYFADTIAVAKRVDIVRAADVFNDYELEIIRDILKPQPQQCYRNAHLLCQLFPERLRYCEGKTFAFIPIEHAFNRVGDKYVDITFEFALQDAELLEHEYVVFGEYDLRTLERITRKTGYYGDIYRNVYIERVKDNPRRNEVTPGVGTQ